jgi:hypothetical protein
VVSQATYGTWAVFMHDACGGHVIAVVWTPAARLAAPLRVRHARDTCPAGTAQVAPHLDAAVAGFLRLGRGLVERVERRPA